MSLANIIYEQPLNEHIRVCLRLEYLLQQIDHHMLLDSSWDTRHALASLLEVLQVTDRPDFKNKFGQALNQYTGSLIQLEQSPNIDKHKLNKTLEQLNKLGESLLHAGQKKIGQELRENELLAAVQQRLYTPAGTCPFNLSAYYLWLEQPAKIRKQQLRDWVDSLQPLQDLVNMVLKLTRESATFKPSIARSGFYQSNLDPNIPLQMIRISIPRLLEVYPDISVGRHRLAVHFFSLAPNYHSSQAQTDIQFELACCRI